MTEMVRHLEPNCCEVCMQLCVQPEDRIQRVNDLHRSNTSHGWLLNNLRILEEMCRDRSVPDWITREIQRLLERSKDVARLEKERGK